MSSKLASTFWKHVLASTDVSPMRISLTLPKVFFAVGMLTLAPASVRPCELARCRCVPASSFGMSAAEYVRVQRDRADRVVMGVVLRLDTLGRVEWGGGHDAVAAHPIVARVRVQRVWRGPLVDTMTVTITTVE